MAWISKKRGKHGVGWRDLSGKERWRTCPDKETAKQLQRDIEQAAALGRDWEPQKPRSVPRLREIAGDWLKSRERLKLSAGTLLHYGAYLEEFLNWYEETHGGEPQALAREVLEDWFDVLLKTGRHGRPRAASTALHHMSAIQLFWTWAARRKEYRPHVPPYDPPELPNRPLSKVTVAPTWEEMDALLQVTKGWHRALIVFLRCTGLRVQQAMRLKWSDVDMERGTLTILPELGKSRQEQTGRVIPLAPVLLKEMKNPKLATWGEEWIIPCAQPHRIARAVVVAKMWEKVTAPGRRAAWEGHPFHAFRRGFISNLRAAGAKESAVEYLVGHAMPGVQASYVDPQMALALNVAVKLVPSLPKV